MRLMFACALARASRLGLLLCVVCFSAQAAPAPKPDPNTVLILYDANGEFAFVGELHARMLANLLGHFALPYQIAPVGTYRSGDLQHYRAGFYLGNVYNNPLPSAFLQDVVRTTKPFCWFKYNLLQLSGSSIYGTEFQTKTGFRFDFMDPGPWGAVRYKNEVLTKNTSDGELGRVTILDPSKGTVAATATHSTNSSTLPYLIKSSNFTYVADSPFSYISEEDRYLVFTDFLHDILGILHPENHRALLRLEDIHPHYSPGLLTEAADYLATEGVPFAISLIPVYSDPLGFDSAGIPELIRIGERPEFYGAVKHALQKGGQIMLHGYTHQYTNTSNPFSGVSGDDYEFFRVVYDAETNLVQYTPVPEDSAAWVQGRLGSASNELRTVGLSPVGWVTPHYAASAMDYGIFAQTFPLTIQRVLYFDSTGQHPAGQFFPYTIDKDIYGQRILPENLGNVDPWGWHMFEPRLPADLIRAARKARVVRDGWASAFFHPYLDLQYLKDLVTGIKALGFSYVAPSTNVPPSIVVDPKGQTNATGLTLRLLSAAIGSSPLKYQWSRNGIVLNAATNATLTINNAQPSHSGSYTVSVQNNFGSRISIPAEVRIRNVPSIRLVRYQNNSASFTFRAETGVTYAIEYKPNLTTAEWNTLRTLVGTGSDVTIFDSSGGPQRFYRIRAL